MPCRCDGHWDAKWPHPWHLKQATREFVVGDCAGGGLGRITPGFYPSVDRSGVKVGVATDRFDWRFAMYLVRVP